MQMKKISNIFKKKEDKRVEVKVASPPKCLTCESEMNLLKINYPFCEECLNKLKKIIKDGGDEIN